jgi:hypothetical protein
MPDFKRQFDLIHTAGILNLAELTAIFHNKVGIPILDMPPRDWSVGADKKAWRAIHQILRQHRKFCVTPHAADSLAERAPNTLPAQLHAALDEERSVCVAQEPGSDRKHYLVYFPTEDAYLIVIADTEDFQIVGIQPVHYSRKINTRNLGSQVYDDAHALATCSSDQLPYITQPHGGRATLVITNNAGQQIKFCQLRTPEYSLTQIYQDEVFLSGLQASEAFAAFAKHPLTEATMGIGDKQGHLSVPRLARALSMQILQPNKGDLILTFTGANTSWEVHCEGIPYPGTNADLYMCPKARAVLAAAVSEALPPAINLTDADLVSAQLSFPGVLQALALPKVWLMITGTEPAPRSRALQELAYYPSQRYIVELQYIVDHHRTELDLDDIDFRGISKTTNLGQYLLQLQTEDPKRFNLNQLHSASIYETLAQSAKR